MADPVVVKRALRRFALLAAAAVAGSALGNSGVPEPRFEPGPCPDGVEAGTARCGTVSVPVRYAAPRGARLNIHVVEIPALEPQNERSALVQLPGGPGLPMTDIASWYFDEDSFSHAVRRHRDVLLFDRRGTGQSSPLRCPELGARHPLEPVDLEAVAACLARLEADGHDLAAYGTQAAARDLEQVRRALGHEQLDLWGTSAGTRLAQAYLRQYPNRVRRMVLVGAVPPDPRVPLHHAAHAQRALQLVFERCRADSACQSAYPDLADDWRRLLARLDDGPVPVKALDPAGETTWTGQLHRGPFGEAFRELLASTASQRKVPHIIHAGANGDFRPLMAELPLSEEDPAFAFGLYLAVACPEGTDRIDPRGIDPAVAGTFLGRFRVDQQRAACERFGSYQAPAELFSPVKSDIPVLLLVGDADYVTPPAWSHEAARELSRSRVVVMPHGGHVYYRWGPDSDAGRCFSSLALQFFELADSDSLDVSCAEHPAPPEFVIPAGEFCRSRVDSGHGRLVSSAHLGQARG